MEPSPPPAPQPEPTAGLNKWKAKQQLVNEARAVGIGRGIPVDLDDPDFSSASVTAASPYAAAAAASPSPEPSPSYEASPSSTATSTTTTSQPQYEPPPSQPSTAPSPQAQAPRSAFAPADLAVVVVGESGSGKSTFLNYVANYFLGGRPGDLRVIISSQLHAANVDGAQQAEMASHDQSVSQTQDSQQYVFGRFVFVDTPGLNDTRGVGNDVKNMQLILDAVSRYQTIAALVVVINGATARFTSSLRLVLTMLASNLPASALGNVFVLLTHCTPETCNFDSEAAASALGLDGQRLMVGERVFHMQNSAFCSASASAAHNADWDDAMETIGRLTHQIEHCTTPTKSSDFLLVRSFRQQLETALSAVLENYRVLAAMPNDASTASARSLLERQIASNITSIDDTCTVLAGLCPKFTFAEELRLRFDKIIMMRNAPRDENERLACQGFLDGFRQLICKYVPEFRERLTALPAAPPPTVPPPPQPSVPPPASSLPPTTPLPTMTPAGLKLPDVNPLPPTASSPLLSGASSNRALRNFLDELGDPIKQTLAASFFLCYVPAVLVCSLITSGVAAAISCSATMYWIFALGFALVFWACQLPLFILLRLWLPWQTCIKVQSSWVYCIFIFLALVLPFSIPSSTYSFWC